MTGKGVEVQAITSASPSTPHCRARSRNGTTLGGGDGSQPLKRPWDEAVVQALVAQGEKRNLTDAYLAGHPRAKRTTAARAGHALMKRHDIRQRIGYLMSPDRNPGILSVQRRKAILSRIAAEIGDADPSDYVVAGKDGSWIAFGPESKNRKVVAGIKSHTDEDGGVITELKLHSPEVARSAIDTLNKMEGIYDDAQPPDAEGRRVVVNILIGGEKKDVSINVGSRQSLDP